MTSVLTTPKAHAVVEFRARYQLQYAGMTVGELRWQLSRRAGNEYLYEAISTPTGLLSLVRDERISERSRWRTTARGFEPLHYEYRRSGGRRDKHITVEFDWRRRIAATTAKGETWRMRIPDGTLDKSIYVLAMMRDLGRGQEDFSYQVADGGKLKTYRLTVVDRETLDTALGKMATIKVRRLRRKKNKRETWMWCAPELGYLPVRIEHIEKDGGRVEIDLQQFTDDSPASTAAIGK